MLGHDNITKTNSFLFEKKRRTFQTKSSLYSSSYTTNPCENKLTTDLLRWHWYKYSPFTHHRRRNDSFSSTSHHQAPSLLRVWQRRKSTQNNPYEWNISKTSPFFFIQFYFLRSGKRTIVLYKSFYLYNVSFILHTLFGSFPSAFSWSAPAKLACSHDSSFHWWNLLLFNNRLSVS